jgi:CheR methyltransferase, all-alpha domain
LPGARPQSGPYAWALERGRLGQDGVRSSAAGRVAFAGQRSKRGAVCHLDAPAPIADRPIVLAHLRVRTGHDFSRYKRSTVLRRIARRMQVTRTDKLNEYYALLREKPEEAQALLADLLISVTTFFRDRHAFETLKTHVLPQVFDGREASESIRVWVFEQRLVTLSLPILVRFNGHQRRVHLHVKPADGRDEQTHGEHRALVMFIEGEAVKETPVSAGQATDETVARLSQELELTQARLRTVREESEGANEELRAANEELQSINEEYRSTSEELETSKEELQSVNEELETLNTELKLKLETGSRANSDLQNLMAATEFGTLFLDSPCGCPRAATRAAPTRPTRYGG